LLSAKPSRTLAAEAANWKTEMTRVQSWLILLLGLLQPITGAFSALTGLGTPIGDATAGTDAPEQPLPAFFSIWGLIFLAYLSVGVAGLLRPSAGLEKAGWPLILAGAFNVVWMLSAQLIVSQPLDFFLLAPIFAAAWMTASRVDAVRGGTDSLLFRITDAASGLLAGWISVAAAITVPLTIRTFTGLGPTDLPWPMFWTTFTLAGLAAFLFATRISRSLWFFAALGWGLTGVVLNNWLRTEMHFIAILAAVGTATILLLRVTQAPKRLTSAG
jgi:hypothetical protein